MFSRRRDASGSYRPLQTDEDESTPPREVENFSQESGQDSDHEKLDKHQADVDIHINEGVGMYQDIQQKIEQLLVTREKTLENLEKLKVAIEESYDKSRKARIGGTVATISGSVISIVGFGLTPVTFGASLGLGITGGVLAAAGGTTIAGAEIGYHWISKSKVRDANEACEKDRNQMEGLKKLGEDLQVLLSSIAKELGTTEEAIYELVKARSRKDVGRAGIYSTYKLFEGFADTGRAVRNTVSVARAGARTAWVGLSTAGRVFGIAGVVFDVVFIPVDVAVLAKSAYDVHRYKGGKGTSNSKSANEVDNLIQRLKEHKSKIVHARDKEEC